MNRNPEGKNISSSRRKRKNKKHKDYFKDFDTFSKAQENVKRRKNSDKTKTKLELNFEKNDN